MLSARGVVIIDDDGTVYVTTEKGGGYHMGDVPDFNTGDIVWVHFDHKGNPKAIEHISAHQEHAIPEIPDDPLLESDIEDYHVDVGDWGEWE